MNDLNIWIRNPEVTAGHIKSLRKGNVIAVGITICSILYFRYKIKSLEKRLAKMEDNKED